MKLKHIILGLLFLIIPYFDYIFIYNHYTLSTENFKIYVNSPEGALSMFSFFISCCTLIVTTLFLIIDNWNKTITLNSILKTIKSIKLN